jgi:TPP-dependent pyruvate/acetoin dehydrogenase alpha subunit
MEDVRVTADVTPAELYRRMFRIRLLEERLLDLFATGALVGTTHTCIGQEANAVGVIAHLDRERDIVVSNHRCHGHYIAFRDDLFGLLAEVMGRVDGVCSGKGGSQHLCAGNFYTNGVQGSIVPLATGMALAEKRLHGDTVVCVFIGDGTLGQGVVYECLNMASLWSLPLLIVCEDNRIAQTTPRELAVAGDVAARAAPFGVKSSALATTDVVEILDAAGAAVEYVRREQAPYFLVLETHRLRAHSKGDDTRDPVDVAAMAAEDPIVLLGPSIPDAERAEIEAAAHAELEEVVAAAERSPVAGRAPSGVGASA